MRGEQSGHHRQHLHFLFLVFLNSTGVQMFFHPFGLLEILVYLHIPLLIFPMLSVTAVPSSAQP
jgi:hypothetical protein